MPAFFDCFGDVFFVDDISLIFAHEFDGSLEDISDLEFNDEAEVVDFCGLELAVSLEGVDYLRYEIGSDKVWHYYKSKWILVFWAS